MELEILTQKFGNPVKLSSTEYKFYCPKCNHKSLTVSLDTGVFYCFYCFYGTGEKPLFNNKVIKSIRRIDYNLHLKVSQYLASNLSLSNYHSNYLKSRGIFNPKQYGFLTVPTRVEYILRKKFTDLELISSGLYKRVLTGDITGWPCLKYNRIFIPVSYNGSVQTFITRVDPREELTDNVKFAIPYGASISKKVSYYPGKSNDLIITEGFLKAISANQYGYSVVGCSGINHIKACYYIKNDPTFNKYRKFIVFDHEAQEDEILSTEQAYKLSSYLGPSSCVVTLPKESKHSKMDIDKYLINYFDDFQNILEDSWYNRFTL